MFNFFYIPWNVTVAKTRFLHMTLPTLSIYSFACVDKETIDGENLILHMKNAGNLTFAQNA